MVKYFKLCHTQEEITRLNMEMHHLQTFIYYETLQTNKTIGSLSLTDPHLAAELWSRWQLQNAVNQLHIQCLNSIEASAIFTGSQGIETPLSADAVPFASEVMHSDVVDSKEGFMALGGRTDDDSEMADEDGAHNLEKITDFILSIMD
jgi:hypothetical protein